MNNKEPKVSVLVAVYNIEKFVKKCIKSIIDQTYKNLEIIIVDDCSEDNSGKICDEMAKMDSRILVSYHKINMRQSCVRNTGLSMATGEYVVFVDGDDWLAPDFVEYFVNLIGSTQSDMAISKNCFTTRDNRQIENDKIEIWEPEQAIVELILPNIRIGCWNKIYRRDFIEKYEIRFRSHFFTAEGEDFILKSSQRANQIAVGLRKIYYYRLNNINSAVTKPDIRQPKGALDTFRDIQNELIIKTDKVYKSLDCKKFTHYMWIIGTILNLNNKKEYKKEWDDAIKYLHSHTFVGFGLNISLKKKLQFLIISLFPVTTMRFINYYKNRKLILDRTE